MPALSTAPRVSDEPGRLRGLQRVLSADGFIEVLAIDHGLDIAVLLSEDPGRVTFAEITEAKDLVIRAARDQVSAVLVDPGHGGHLVSSGAIGPRTGLVVGVEDEDYRIPPGARATRLRAGWSPQQAHNMGADLAKLLWWFRSDAETADDQRAVLHRVIADAHEASIPLVVEPIWYPLPGEEPSTVEWQSARARGIVESAVEVDRAGADVLKVEFPGQVSTADGRSAACDAVQELNERTSAPWAILSAGVDFESFATQLEIACTAGASGYVAGRAVWRDLIGMAVAREDTVLSVRSRLARLNEIAAAHGRPVLATRDLGDSLALLGDRWYDGATLGKRGNTQTRE